MAHEDWMDDPDAYLEDDIMPTGDSTLSPGGGAILRTLRAGVEAGRLGGPEDGAARYPVEKFASHPENPSETAGRCMTDGRPWDDHRSIPTIPFPPCPGLADFGPAKSE